jgi:hypothetical protein
VVTEQKNRTYEINLRQRPEMQIFHFAVIGDGLSEEVHAKGSSCHFSQI